jgi:4-hydroxybenzoate polyprenyltransferase
MDSTPTTPAPPPQQAHRPSLGLALVRTARPGQWVKNLFVLAAVVFSGELRKTPALLQALLAMAAFVLASASTYFWNDLIDRQRDRQHPRKSRRPIASGQVSPGLATFVAAALALAAMAVAAQVNLPTLCVLGIYIALQLAYTMWLKHWAIIDVMCIAIGFVLRTLAGATAVHVPASAWLLVCTLFLAMFLGFAKRRGELVRLVTPTQAAAGRPVLVAYTDHLLLALLGITCSLTLLSYALYAVERKPPSYALLASIPVAAYGLFRYLLLAMRTDDPAGESPENLLVRDPGLIASAVVGAALAVLAVLTTGAVQP